MLDIGTLNLLCGGPSAGKTTLVYQAIRAHERGEPFIVPNLRFPAGSICIINTDRKAETNRKFFDLIGIHDVQLISLVDDTELSRLTKPVRDESFGIQRFRDALSERIYKMSSHPSTLILDLYGEFVGSSSANLKALAYEGRLNVQWAQHLKVALLGLPYPYKQKVSNYALRVQDRIAGGLAIQASANWKFNICDKSETKTCWIIDVIPPPMGGKPQTYYAMRQDDEDGVGRFVACEPPYDADDVETLMERYAVDERQAKRILKKQRENDD